jgi:TetR/AcrR family transcriptional regulator, regulator of autoinduction and epiphytic fitness
MRHARPIILNAARRLFNNESYDSISVERIAAHAGVTRHTLGNHFSSKAEIFKICREQVLSALAERVDGEIPVQMEPVDGILYFLEYCLTIISDEQNLELVRSIVRDGAAHLWLSEAHERRVRLRLVKNCETYLLYKTLRADLSVFSPGQTAAQLVMLVEALVLGPYLKGAEGYRPMEGLKRHLMNIARTYGLALEGECRTTSRNSENGHGLIVSGDFRDTRDHRSGNV